MSTLNAVTTAGYGGYSVGLREPKQTLGQEEFLQLLVAQMTTQDPMSPSADTDVFAQMATFSSLEQSKVMQADLSRLRMDQQVLQANSLLGRTVEIQVNDSALTRGLVTDVHVEAGTPKVVVDGRPYDLSQVLTISPTSFNPNANPE
ncbi:MAG: flagellar hook capping FlgD N-terminal domain-containing protein [Limisphaerales bacterium]